MMSTRRLSCADPGALADLKDAKALLEELS
jgi:hypothetical protein